VSTYSEWLDWKPGSRVIENVPEGVTPKLTEPGFVSFVSFPLAPVSEKPSKLDRQKEQAIAALLAKPTIEEAAAAVGIGYATLRRWLQDPGFATEYRRARRDLVSQVAAQLQSAAGEAVAALVAIVRDPEAPASARVSGARTILEFTSRAVETEDLTARIETLERAAAARDGKSIRAVS